MNCEQARLEMIDSANGQVSAELGGHLRECAACTEEWALLQATWERMGAWQSIDPPARVGVSFGHMLDAYESGLKAAAPQKRAWWSHPAWAGGLAAACLMAGFFAGSREQPLAKSDVAELRREVGNMRQLVTLSLLRQQSATERLRGVTWSYQTEVNDVEVLSALLQTIGSDPNVNVRLAAVDAVRKFAESPVARKGLVQSFSKQTSPLMQIAVAEALAEMDERTAVKPIQAVLDRDDLDPTTRERLQWVVKALK